MRHHRVRYLALLGLLIFGRGEAAIVNVDLPTLIDQSVGHPNRFAVDVPFRASAQSTGTWATAGSNQVWRYSVQIPTAVSMSFFADSVHLPASATLTMTAGPTVYTYRPLDIRRGTLWSRVARGDRLDFELTVAAADRARVRFEIASLQAGYRSLDRGGGNNPHYDQLRRTARASVASTCVENYECDADAANQGPGRATVALIIGNIGQCTGTLLNDVPVDGTPYVLTARHCENDTLGGGAPHSAANLSVYWDATTACGQVLGTIYDPGISVQTGATSVVEQQDAWLIQLDDSPIVSDAYFAGWNATGLTFSGGYTIHHAESNSKQYTAWFGPALQLTVPGAQLENIGYTSNFLGVVNQLGSIAPGASGSGLFDDNGLLRGSLSLGVVQVGSGIQGQCPASQPMAPTANNIAAEFTDFGSVFTSTADTTSTTNSLTLQTVLDPQRTGVLSLTGNAGAGTISIAASSTAPAVGSSVTLTWSAPAASACTAAGGVAGDGWAGALAPGGSRSVSESTQSDATYSINCVVGTQHLTAQLQLNWGNASPTVGLFVIHNTQWIGGSVAVMWSGNTANCTLSGPGVQLTGQSASGSYTVSESVAGSYLFTVSCGVGSQTAQAQGTAIFIAPMVTLTALSPRLAGEPFTINYQAYADNCVPSGGGSDPTWTANDIVGGDSVVWLNERSPGTFTYTLTCTSGTSTAQGSVTVTVENGPPSVTLTSLAGSSVPFGNPINLSWSSNVDDCIESEPTPNPSNQWDHGVSAEGTQVIQEPVAGMHTYVMTCGAGFSFGTAQAQVTVNVTPSTTGVSLSSSASQVSPGQSFTLTWSSTNAFGCTGSGAGSGNQWDETAPTSGALTFSESAAGTYTFVMTCGAGSQNGMAQTIVTVGNPSSSGGSGATGGTAVAASHGGGALALPDLIGLAGYFVMHHRRRRRLVGRRPHPDG
ncbi:MAG TPA: hypothetical protein VGV09_21185 [Steroidobacteraceae bacterium]|nr:hypothetical protein [Steroidobacteraceae bacterium]